MNVTRSGPLLIITDPTYGEDMIPLPRITQVHLSASVPYFVTIDNNYSYLFGSYATARDFYDDIRRHLTDYHREPSA